MNISAVVGIGRYDGERVWQLGGRKTGKGARIGALVGTGLGALLVGFSASVGGDWGAGVAVSSVLITSSVGIGVGVGAMQRERTLIYSAPLTPPPQALPEVAEAAESDWRNLAWLVASPALAQQERVWRVPAAIATSSRPQTGIGVSSGSQEPAASPQPAAPIDLKRLRKLRWKKVVVQLHDGRAYTGQLEEVGQDYLLVIVEVYRDARKQIYARLRESPWQTLVSIRPCPRSQ